MNQPRARLVSVALLPFLVLVCEVAAQSKIWQKTDESGVAVEVAFNKIIKSKAGDRRELFIYIEPTAFSPESVRKVFLFYSTKFPKPSELVQTLYSDKTMLRRAYNSATRSFFIDWNDTSEGRKASAEWSAKYEPLPTGYLRALYYRKDRYNPKHVQEEYSYSPNAQGSEMVTVVVQTNPCPCPQEKH